MKNANNAAYEMEHNPDTFFDEEKGSKAITRVQHFKECSERSGTIVETGDLKTPTGLANFLSHNYETFAQHLEHALEGAAAAGTLGLVITSGLKFFGIQKKKNKVLIEEKLTPDQLEAKKTENHNNVLKAENEHDASQKALAELKHNNYQQDASYSKETQEFIHQNGIFNKDQSFFVKNRVLASVATAIGSGIAIGTVTKQFIEKSACKGIENQSQCTQNKFCNWVDHQCIIKSNENTPERSSRFSGKQKKDSESSVSSNSESFDDTVDSSSSTLDRSLYFLLFVITTLIIQN